MASELLIGWDAERAELKAELSRLEEELAESRAETEELRSRTNALTERLSQTLDSSVSFRWESEQREWRKKLKEGRERESRQALLILKLQQKVMEYRSRCEHLQQRVITEEREMRVRERILQDERSDNLETTLIRLEEEQQRSVTLVEVNALLRCELSQSGEANQALQEDLKKLTADWSKAVEDAGQKEMDWNKEKEVLSAYIEAERSRLLSLWSRVVTLRRQCHAVKVATDKDLWELRAEFTRLSSTFLSLKVLPALSSSPPPPPPHSYTSGPMILAELDHDFNTEKLKSRIDELSAVVKSQELERQRQEEAMKSSSKKEEKERERQQEKYRELEKTVESVTQAVRKLYRALGSQRSDAHKVFPDPGVFSDDLHSVLWVISEAEGAFQKGRHDVQEAEGKWRTLRVETESLQQQIAALEKEKAALQKQASLEAIALKQAQSLMNSEKETALSLKRQLDESERRSEDLKRENVRLIQQRERQNEEWMGIESERQKRIEAKLVEDAHLCEQQSRARIELHTLQVALEQERMEKARAEKELVDTRDALATTRESLLALSSTYALLQRDAADTRDSLEKMASLNESLAQDKRELGAQNLQLEEQVTDSQLQLQRLQSDVASLQKELHAVSEGNTELRACRNADLDSLHLLRGREREMDEELQIMREERERDSNALADEKMQNEQLSEQYRSVCEELRTMKEKLDKELDQEKRAQRVREELQREKQRLEEQVHSMSQEKEEIKQDREELRNLTGNLQQQLCVAKEQISVLEVQCTQLQMQIHALQQARDVLRGEIKCLESELEKNSFSREEENRRASDSQTRCEKEIENCQMEIARLKAEAQALLNNQRIHEEDRESWQREREALNSELGLKDGEVGALKNRMDGLVKENENLAILIGEKDGDVETLLSEIRSLESQMQEAKGELDELKERLTDSEREKEELLERMRQDSEENVKMTNILKTRDGEMEESSKRIEDLMENIRLKDILIEKIKRELEEKEIGIADKINEEKRIQKEREAEEREKELKLKGEIKLKENELERLKHNVEELKTGKEHVSHLLQERDADLDKLNSRVVDLEQKYLKAKDEMVWWKEKVGDVAREKEVLIERVKKHLSVEQERNKLADMLQEREEEIKILKKNEQDMVSDHERMKEEYREKEKKLKQRDGEIEEHRHTIIKMMEEKHEQEKWKMQLDDLKKEKISLEEKKHQQEKGEQRMIDEINELRVKIGELDKENCEVKRKVLEQKDQLQVQTVFLKEKEVDLNRLRETLEQKKWQGNEELIALKEKLRETEFVQEKERNIQKECDQKLQLTRDKVATVEENVKELEVKNKSLIQEADVARRCLLEKLKELETKSKLLQENEEKRKTIQLRMESVEEEKEQLERSSKEIKGEMERLKIEMKERKENEEKLRLELEQQILDLGEDVVRKDGIIEEIELILKQKEKELKQAKENKDAASKEVTELKEELSMLFVSKEKAETLLKERDIENKTIKEGIKAGLEEMVTLKELLEESRSEGEKLRKIFEEKMNDKIKGGKEEVRAAREEVEYLKRRVQILQKENEDLQAQQWIREENDIKMKCEVRETLKMTLDGDVTDKNELKGHELLKDERNKCYQPKGEKHEIDRIKNSLEEREIAVLESEMEKKDISFDLVKDDLGKNRETDSMKRKIQSNAKMDRVERQRDENEMEVRIISEFEEENARHLLQEQHEGAQMETDFLKRQMEREEQTPGEGFQMNESQSQPQMKENIEFQAEVYDLKKEADELRKDRDRLRTALEKNEAMLIHYQERAHQLGNKVQVGSDCEEESQKRVCALQRAVAELELKLLKLQQKNERLEHRIEKLRLEKTNLRETLKQVELEREKLRCWLSQSDAQIQECSSPSGADELKYLKARASELTVQVHQLRLLLASDHQERADFIDQSLKNSKSLQTLRQDLNVSLTLVSKQLAPSVLECETQRLDRSIREEQLRTLLSHS